MRRFKLFDWVSALVAVVSAVLIVAVIVGVVFLLVALGPIVLLAAFLLFVVGVIAWVIYGEISY
jgi:hypothetical protein